MLVYFYYNFTLWCQKLCKSQLIHFVQVYRQYENSKQNLIALKYKICRTNRLNKVVQEQIYG